MKAYPCLISLLALASVLSGCSKRPSVTIYDPRAYLMDRLIHMEHHAWWYPYRITDETFIGNFLDERIAKERSWSDELPTDDKSLDRFFNRIKPGLSRANTETPEARARVLDKIQWRFANPQVKKARKKEMYPGIAIVDFGYVPGEWRKDRSGWSFQSQGTDGFDLAPATIARGFKLAHETYPEASTYLVTGQVFYGSSSHHSEYQYDTTSGRLFYVHNVSRNYSQDTYPIENIVSGEVTLSAVEWEAAGGEISLAEPVMITMRPLEDPHDYIMDYARK